jgi:hypothetical protein
LISGETTEVLEVITFYLRLSILEITGTEDYFIACRTCLKGNFEPITALKIELHYNTS